jgi:hypothetical protein
MIDSDAALASWPKLGVDYRAIAWGIFYLERISDVMQRYFTKTNLVSFAICLLVGGCFDANHPDTSRYEYLYMNGHFQSPYNAFPQGLARESWKCLDEKTQIAYDCTMVRGGWEHFQYIYRARKAA